jgi:phage-related protein
MLELFDALRNIEDRAKRNDYTRELFGRGGAQLAEMMNMGSSAIDNFRASIDTAFAGMADKYKDELVTLAGQVGRIGVEITKVVLPALEIITPHIVGFLQAFNNLDGPVKTAIGALAVLAIGITSLSFVLVPLIMLFTGPAGIVVAIGLGIAAVVALAVAFKDKLGGLPAFVLEIMQAVANPIGAALKLILDLVGKLFSALAPLVEAAVKKLWKWLGDRFNDLGKLIGGLADGAGKILGGVGNAVRNAFMAIPDLLRSAVNGALSWAGNAVNSVIGLVNSLIRGVNQAAAAVRLPGIPEIPYVSVPQFAAGGYVTGPTLGVIGEGGQPEYIIPASRMADASAAYLGGSRGAEVLNGTGGARAGVRPGITIQTGPVLQQPDGSRWVSMEDLERGMAAAVDQALGIVASPAGRMALGGA